MASTSAALPTCLPPEGARAAARTSALTPFSFLESESRAGWESVPGEGRQGPQTPGLCGGGDWEERTRTVRFECGTPRSILETLALHGHALSGEWPSLGRTRPSKEMAQCP